MRRLYLPVLLSFALILGNVLLHRAAAPGLAARPPAPQGVPAVAPVPCPTTPLSFNLTGTGTLEALRAFSTTPGERVVQFDPAPPITTTLASSGALLVDNSVSGATDGDITGTFAMRNLNGIAVTGTTAGPEARGYEINKLVITGTQGGLTLLVAFNFTASSAKAPYYPRTISGYVYSIAATGIYTPVKFSGTISGTLGAPVGGAVPFTGAVAGNLYTGFGNAALFIANGNRPLPPLHGVLLQPADTLAQFQHPDFHPSNSGGNLSATSVFSGTIFGGLPGSFQLENNQLLDGNSLTFSFGWLAGNFRLAATANDRLSGVWLSDLVYGGANSYVFQTGGTGTYAGSFIFGEGQAVIGYNGGTDLASAMSGGYCLGAPAGTATPTPLPGSPTATVIPPTATAPGPTASPPPSETGTATVAPSSPTPTATPVPPTPALSATPGPSQTPAPPPPGTATAVPPTPALSATPGPTQTPAPTATDCPVVFADVPPGSPFDSFIHCLSCRGIVGGYGDGTFRPAGPVTRGQMAKFIANAAGYADSLPGAPQTFADVPPGQPFWVYVERAAQHGVISGYGCGGAAEPCDPARRPYFRPGAPVTRGQAAKFVAGAAGYLDLIPVAQQTFADVPPGDPFWLYIERAGPAMHGLISGYGCGQAPAGPCDPGQRPYFLPTALVTRGQAAKFLANAFFPNCALRR